MANKIQLRRGLKSAMPTGSAGEPLYATDTRELFIGTGSGNVNMGGSHWYRGTAMSGTSTTANAYSYSACPDVKLDDIYMNTSNGNIYACTTAGSGSAAKWTYQGCIKGATGATGAKGATGKGFSTDSAAAILMLSGVYTKYTPEERKTMNDALGYIFGTTYSQGCPDNYSVLVDDAPSSGTGFAYLIFQDGDGNGLTIETIKYDNRIWDIYAQNGNPAVLYNGESALIKFTTELSGSGKFKCYKIFGTAE